MFASGAPGVSRFRVWFDDELIASRAMPGIELPKNWQAPATTPGLRGETLADLAHRVDDVTPFAFEVVVEPGRQELKVRYAAEAA